MAVGAGFLTLWLGLVPARGQQVSNHRVFVGIDLFVSTAAGRTAILDFADDQALLAGNPPTLRGLRDIPTFGWDHRPKVGRLPVIIRNLETRFESSVQADQVQRRLREMSSLLDYSADRFNLSLRSGLTPFTPPSSDDLARHHQLTREAHARLESLPFPGPERVHEGPLESGDALFSPGDAEDKDVLNVSFEIFTPRPVAEAHLVALAHVKQAGEPGVVVFHHPLGAIGPDARRIKVRKTGFRPGFELTALKLHVFAHGQELPTNLSERASFLTATEAHRFLLLSHLTDHPQGDLPPQPIWSLAPAALFAARAAADFDLPLAVNIDAEGRLLSIHQSETTARAYLAAIPDATTLHTKASPTADGSAPRPAEDDPALDAAVDSDIALPEPLLTALREMVFLPALRDGTPVLGTTTINLADFLR